MDRTTDAINPETNPALIQGIWRCTLCKFTPHYFTSPEDFNFHLKSFCHACTEEFTSASVFYTHNQLKHYQKHMEKVKSVERRGQRYNTFYCDYCTRILISEAELYAHMEKHKNYQCVGCFKTFAEFQGWCDHVSLCQMSWRKMASVEITIECFGCFRKFPSTLKRQCHYPHCNYAISKDAMETKMSRETIAKKIMVELVLMRGADRNSLMIRVPQNILRSNPIVQANGTAGIYTDENGNGNLRQIQNQVDEMNNEELPIGSDGITREKTVAPNGKKNSFKRPRENYSETTNSFFGTEMAAKKTKKNRPTLTKLSDQSREKISTEDANILLSDSNPNEENKPKIR